MLNNYSKLANKNYGLAPVTDLSKPNKETLARTSEATKLLLEKNINVKIKSTTVSQISIISLNRVKLLTIK